MSLDAVQPREGGRDACGFEVRGDLRLFLDLEQEVRFHADHQRLLHARAAIYLGGAPCSVMSKQSIARDRYR